MRKKIWVVVLEANRAQVLVMKRDIKLLEPLKEICGPAKSTEETVVRELASYLDHQSIHEQFDQLILASSVKLVALLCAKLKLQTCTKFIGTLHFEEQVPTLEELYAQVISSYGTEV